MPTLTTLIDSPLLYTASDGRQNFVHDTYRDFFLAKYFAEKINSGKMSVAEAFTVWSCPEERNLWGLEEMVKEGERTFLPAWKPVVFFLTGLVKDQNHFIRELNQHDPHLAARCLRYCSPLNEYMSQPEDSTAQEVVSKLSSRLTLNWAYEKALAVESLGETRSDLALPPLTKMLYMPAFWGPCYEDKGNVLVALSKLPYLRAIETLYSFCTNYSLITGRHPAYKRTAFLALWKNTFPVLLSTSLWRKFENGELYQLALLTGEEKGNSEELEKKLTEILRGKLTFGHKLTTVEDFFYQNYRLPVFNPDEDVTADEFLEAMAQTSGWKGVKRLSEYAFTSPASEHCPKEKWKQAAARRVLPYVQREPLEHLIKLVEEQGKVHFNGSDYLSGTVYVQTAENVQKMEENVKEQETKEQEKAALYFAPKKIEAPMRFTGQLFTLLNKLGTSAMRFYDAHNTEVTEVHFPDMLAALSYFAEHQEAVLKVEVTSPQARETLEKFVEETYASGYLRWEARWLQQLQEVKQQLRPNPLSHYGWPSAQNEGIPVGNKSAGDQSQPKRRTLRETISSFRYFSKILGHYDPKYEKITSLPEAVALLKNTAEVAEQFIAMFILAHVGTRKDLPYLKEEMNKEVGNKDADLNKTFLANAIALIQEKTRPVGYNVNP